MRYPSDLQVALEAVCNIPYILFRDDLMNANADGKKTLPCLCILGESSSAFEELLEESQFTSSSEFQTNLYSNTVLAKVSGGKAIWGPS